MWKGKIGSHKVTLITASIISLVLLCCCGRLDINLRTNVTAQGDVIQEVATTGSGKMGEYLRNNYNSQGYSKEGWQANIQENADSVTVTQKKVFKPGETTLLPSTSTKTLTGVDFHVDNYIVVKEYILSFTIPGSPPTKETTPNQYTQWAQDLVNSMFGMSWTITLPGEILQTNADVIKDNSATWKFNAQSLQKDRYLMIKSRYIDWVMIVIICCGVIAGLWVITYIRKGQKLRNETGNITQGDIVVSQKTLAEHNITCFYHQNENAIQVCPVCKRPICVDCNYGLQDKTPLCRNCFDNRRNTK